MFLLGIVQWFKESGPRPLVVTSLGLAATMAIREEAVFLVPLVAVLVAFRERRWARRAKMAILIALPGLFVFALWTMANWLIIGEPPVLVRIRFQPAGPQCTMAAQAPDAR